MDRENDRRVAARERQRRRRERLRAEQRDEIRQQDRQRTQERRNNYNEEERQVHLNDDLHENCIQAQLISGSARGSTVLIPRIKINPSDANIPFVLHRIQFPLRLSYSMTINKAQGQTFEKVGIYLPQPVFTHGQLYVAFSRAKAMENVKVKIVNQRGDDRQGHRNGITFTQNIVYQDVL